MTESFELGNQGQLVYMDSCVLALYFSVIFILGQRGFIRSE